MKTIFPNYYKNFKCISSKCRHSCCIGWEIDIDKDTFEFYNSLNGEFANKIKSSISNGDEPHFILDENERCPHLNKNGLCNIICELGKDALCDICADHPRFRNFYFDCTELGLGLCCEAAAELILKSDEPFFLENFDLTDDVYTDEERELLKIRSDLIDIMKNRNQSIFERHNNLLAFLNCSLPEKPLSDWCAFFLSLERLDPSWTNLLTKLKSSSIGITYEECNDVALEALTIYFLYRHIPTATSFEQLKQFVCFSVISTQIIMALSSISEDAITDIARMYSAEIEYSDENIIKICNEF